jgi:FKBP-type peptidyl-prolyl cis-trans isomerase FkpA
MRKLIICVFVILLTVSACSDKPKTEDQKALYAMGAGTAKNLSILDLSPEDYKFIMQGMNDAVAGKKLEADPEIYQQNINQLLITKMQAATQKRKELAKSYLEKAAKEKDAQKTASGLVYQQIKPGTGAQPKPSDIVVAHIKGTFIDGKEFESTLKRGKPAAFPLSNIFPCATEGIGMMKVGGKAKLICPSDIAYGDQGRPPIIPGGSALIFEVELLDIKKASSATAPALNKSSLPKGESKK